MKRMERVFHSSLLSIASSNAFACQQHPNSGTSKSKVLPCKILKKRKFMNLNGIEAMDDYIIFNHIIYMKFKIYNFSYSMKISHERYIILCTIQARYTHVIDFFFNVIIN